MMEWIKQYLAHRWGFVTSGEHMRLLEKNLGDLRSSAEHSIMVRENDRLALHAENKRLRCRVRDAEEELAFRKANFTEAVITRPDVRKVPGDF